MATRKRTARRSSRTTTRVGGSAEQEIKKAVLVLNGRWFKGPYPRSLWVSYRGADELFAIGSKVPEWGAAHPGAPVRALATTHDLMRALNVNPRLEEAVLGHYPMKASSARSSRAAAPRRGPGRPPLRAVSATRRKPRADGHAESSRADFEQAAAAQ